MKATITCEIQHNHYHDSNGKVKNVIFIVIHQSIKGCFQWKCSKTPQSTVKA